MAAHTGAKRAKAELDTKVTEVAMRCVAHLQQALGACGDYMKEPELDSQSVRFARAATAFAQALVTFNGDPLKVMSIAELGEIYVRTSRQTVDAVLALVEKDNATCNSSTPSRDC